MDILGLPALYRILESQLFWGCIGLILAAIALSGKLSMRASALLLVGAWMLGCLGLYRIEALRDWSTIIGSWFFLGVALAVLGWWLQPLKPHLDKPEPGILPLLPFGLFEIEILEGELYWRDAGTQQLVPFTPDPDNQTPPTATVVLAVYARITAIPAQLLENIELAIVGQLLPLSPGYWHSTEISGERSNYFYFDLPPSIPLGKHPVRLVATTSLRGASYRKEFPPFDTYTARTYHQLHAYDPQKFPNPS